MAGLRGPPWPADNGRSASVSALGPAGGAFPVGVLTSATDGVRLGTDPKAGADGATGGGDTSLLDDGSCDMDARGLLGSRSRMSRSSRGSLDLTS